MNWADNIPEQGVLCKDGDVFSLVVTKLNYKPVVVMYSGEERLVNELTPITPKEWWQFAPWQDMDSIPTDGTKVLIKESGLHENEYVFIGDSNSPSICAIAWLPLPEQSK